MADAFSGGAAPRPALRLVCAQDCEDDAFPDESPAGLSPAMTLCEFFEHHFVPVVLKGRGAADGTIDKMRDAMSWWRRLTGDPPLRQIDDYATANFAAGLDAAEWRRGLLGSPRRLASYTIARHLENVGRVLARAGAKGLIAPPEMPARKGRSETKES